VFHSDVFFFGGKKAMERVKLRSSFGGVHQIQKGPLAANLRRKRRVNDGDGEVRHANQLDSSFRVSTAVETQPRGAL